MKTMKKLLAVFLALAMVFGYAPQIQIFGIRGGVNAEAEEADPTHGGTYAEWTSTTSLPKSGSFYLGVDVTISAQQELTGTLNLDLAGRTVNIASTTVIYGLIRSKSASYILNIMDCTGEGVFQYGSGAQGALFFASGANIQNNISDVTIKGYNAVNQLIRVQDGGKLTLKNVTIQDCQTNNANSLISESGASTIKFIDCVVDNCKYTGTGAGSVIEVEQDTATLEISGSEIKNCSGYNGGVIYNSYNGTIMISDTDFIDNEADASGGVIYSTKGTINVVDCTFTGNTSATSAGAIGAAGGTINVTGGTFTGNSTDSNGGAIWSTKGNIDVVDCTFTSNTSATNAGAIGATGGTINVTGGTFTGNSTGSNGGALYSRGTDASNTATINVTGGTYTGNTAKLGGAQFVGSSGFLNIKDCTITGNTSSQGASFTGAVYAQTATSTLNLEGKNYIIDNFYTDGKTRGDVQLQNADCTVGIKNSDKDALVGIRSNAYSSHNASWGTVTGELLGCYVMLNDESKVFVNNNGTINVATADYKPWLSATTFPTTAGNYILVRDITLSSNNYFSGTVNVKLNGHTVTLSGTPGSEGYIRPSAAGAVMNITNDSETGGFVYSSGSSKSLFFANVAGTINVTNAKISGYNGTAQMICAQKNSTMTFTDCEITDCVSTATNGPIYISASSVEFNESKIKSVSANGPILNVTSDTTFGASELGLYDCEIDGIKNNINSSTALINVNKSTLEADGTTFKNCEIYGVKAKDSADNMGLITMNGDKTATVTLTDCTFQDNTAGYYEELGSNITAAVPCAAVKIGTFTATGCTFTGNVSSFQGAIAVGNNSGAYAVIDDCTFTDNTGVNASGIYVGTAGKTLIKDSTFTGNHTTSGAGGAVYLLSQVTTTVDFDTAAARNVLKGANVIKDNTGGTNNTPCNLMLQNETTVFTLEDPTDDTEIHFRSAAGRDDAVGKLTGDLLGSYTYDTDTTKEVIDDDGILTLLTMPTDVVVVPANVTLLPGNTTNLQATISPSGVVTDVIWESDDDSVATVSDTGLVTAVADGETDITVTTVLGGLSATCHVKVVGDIVYEGKTYQPWLSTTTLPKANANGKGYYLVDNVALTAYNALTGSLDLLLNGKEIKLTAAGAYGAIRTDGATAAGSVINIVNNSTDGGFNGAGTANRTGTLIFANSATPSDVQLNVKNVHFYGSTGKSSSSGTTVTLNTIHATFTDCRFTNNSTGIDGAGLYLSSGANATLTGCEFSDNTGNNELYVNGATVNLDGTNVVSALYLTASATANYTNLTDDTTIGITGDGTRADFGTVTGDFLGTFTMVGDERQFIVDEDGKLILMAPDITYEGKVYTAYVGKNLPTSNPTKAGVDGWYLTKDVTIAAQVIVANDLDLNLNGHTVTTTKVVTYKDSKWNNNWGVIIIPRGADPTVNIVNGTFDGAATATQGTSAFIGTCNPNDDDARSSIGELNIKDVTFQNFNGPSGCTTCIQGNTTATFENCTFTNCKTTGDGAAIYAASSDIGVTLTIKDCSTTYLAGTNTVNLGGKTTITLDGENSLERVFIGNNETTSVTYTNLSVDTSISISGSVNRSDFGTVEGTFAGTFTNLMNDKEFTVVDGKLVAKYPDIIYEGKTYQAWESTTTLPKANADGKGYYLRSNVTISDSKNITPVTGNLDLLLNGKEVKLAVAGSYGAIRTDSKTPSNTIINVVNNSLEGGFNGAGVANRTGTLVFAQAETPAGVELNFENVAFYGTTGSTSGNMVSIRGEACAAFIDCYFHDNTVGEAGAAFWADTSGEVIFNGCAFENNSLISEEGTGSSIYSGAGFTTIKDCTFDGDTSKCAIMIGGDALCESLTFTNSDARYDIYTSSASDGLEIAGDMDVRIGTYKGFYIGEVADGSDIKVQISNSNGYGDGSFIAAVTEDAPANIEELVSFLDEKDIEAYDLVFDGENFKYSLKEDVPEVKIEEVQGTISDALNIGFVVDGRVPNFKNEVRLEIAQDGIEENKQIAPEYDYETQTYKFNLNDILPQFMNDNFVMRFIDKDTGKTITMDDGLGEEVDHVDYSVKKYLTAVFKAYESPDYTKEQKEAGQQLVATFMNYGLEAQKKSGWHKNSLLEIPEEIQPFVLNYTSVEDSERIIGEKNSAHVYLKSANLRLENYIKIVFKVYVESGYEENAFVTIKDPTTGQTEKLTLDKATYLGDNTYEFTSRGLTPKEYTDLFEISSFEAEEKDATRTIKYSARSYLYAKQNTESVRPLVLAIYNYEKAANDANLPN